VAYVEESTHFCRANLIERNHLKLLGKHWWIIIQGEFV